MKRLIYLSFAGSIAVVSAFCQKPIVVNPKVKEVTVYLSGAEVRMTEIISLKQGINIIQFKGLSSSLVDNSVQISVGSDTEIISVTTTNERLLPVQVKPALTVLNDSIELLTDQMAMIVNQLDAYDMERKTLQQNQHLTNTQSTLADLGKAADFFRDRTLKINNSVRELQKNHERINALLATNKEKLAQEIKSLSLLRYVITATVSSKTDHVEKFAIRHRVEDASWEASYDILATEINRPITLKYKASIFNDTGDDWQNVKLFLSTGDASMDASRPYLTTWTLNYSSAGNEGYFAKTNMRRGDRNFDTTRVDREISVSELNKTFAVEQSHSIPSDGEPYRISLQSETLPASFEYLTIPKMELSVFLLAKVTGWEKLNLIDGTANVYYGNLFIGQSDINTRSIGDTLELSLGRDNQIVVNRVKIEDKGSTQSLGGKRSESFVYEIQLRNNRKEPIAIKMLDQVPISQEKDIVVEPSDISGAALDIPSGRLQWIRNLNAGEAVKYRVAFSVKYPKNRTVIIRKNRVVSTPRYRH